MRWHATQFGLFDFHVARHTPAHGGQWCFHSSANVGCTTNNLQRFVFAGRHLADAQLVCIGMRFDSDHFGNDDAAEPGSDGLNSIHFQTCHGQLLRELLRVQFGVYPLSQPGFTEFHNRNAFT